MLAGIVAAVLNLILPRDDEEAKEEEAGEPDQDAEVVVHSHRRSHSEDEKV